MAWIPLNINQNKRLFGLDVIRSVAILCVIYGHGLPLFYTHINSFFFNATFVHSGFYGVELFFVLSGFLIGTIFIRENILKQKLDFKSILAFWKRRWYRTLPNYFFILILYVIVFLSFGDELPAGGTLVRYLFFMQNFISVNPQFFASSWSLSVEEWFYLLLPFIFIIGLFFTKQRYLFWIIIAFILGINLFRYIVLYYNPGRQVHVQVLFKLDSIMFGVLLAHIQISFNIFNKTRIKMLFIAGIILFLATYYFCLNKQKLLVLPFVSLSFALMLPYFYHLKIKNKFVQLFFTYISTISYSLYLTHLLIYDYIIKKLFHVTGSSSALLAFSVYLFLSFLISTLFYKYWELPFMNLRDKAPMHKI